MHAHRWTLKRLVPSCPRAALSRRRAPSSPAFRSAGPCAHWRVGPLRTRVAAFLIVGEVDRGWAQIGAIGGHVETASAVAVIVAVFVVVVDNTCRSNFGRGQYPHVPAPFGKGSGCRMQGARKCAAL